MLQWDDLRVFLAVHRKGSHAGAARVLAVDPTTIGRRVAALEEALGAPVFRRTRAGLVANEEGLRLAVRALAIEAEVLAAEREAGTGAASLQGLVRITGGDGLLTYVLAPALGQLLTHHPLLRLELRDDYRRLDLASGEADVAIRLARPKEASLVARRLGSVQLKLFASESYLSRFGRPTTAASLSEHQLVAYEPAVDKAPFMAWLHKNARNPIRVRCSSTAAMVAACVAGQGVTIAMPQSMKGLQGVVEVLPRETIPTTDVWGVVHSDGRRNPRVKAVLDWMAKAFEVAGMGL